MQAHWEILILVNLSPFLLAQGEIRVAATPLRPGQTVMLSVEPTRETPATYRWWVTQGHLVGPVAGPSVLFVAPPSGAAMITAIEETPGSTRLRNRILLVAQAAGGTGSNPAVAAETETYDIGRGGFAPSGWMGDATQEAIQTEVSDDGPLGARSSRRWVFKPIKTGAKGWTAVAYQYPPGNWGDKEGRDLTGSGFKELSVWARGVRDKYGRYPVIQFKAGGGTDPTKRYQASFEVEGDFVTLTGYWRRYAVNLKKKDFSSVVSAFTFVLRTEDNSQGAEFFLSQIEYK